MSDPRPPDADPTSGDAGQPPGRPAYPPPAPLPTQAGPDGIRFDFNLGCRVVLPEREDGARWRVRLRDLHTGNVLFETGLAQGFVNSAKRWFVRFRIEAWAGDDPVPLFRHDYDARGREVLVQFPVGTLGDTVGWLPYAARFAADHGARLTCAMSGLVIPLFRHAYPDIAFVTHEEVDAARFYASYCLGLFFDDADGVWQPADFRMVGLHRSAGYILGVDPAPPVLALPDESRPMVEPYVCIGVQSSSQCKYWNNPAGWRAVVRRLAARGYRAVCIDQRAVHGTGLVWTHVPHGAQDETGDRPLTERARWLRHAAGFVGLSSGLAWLAWAARTPVLMISGFTHPTNEFATPFRVFNAHSCNSCWNDPRLRFDHKDFLWCPRHAGTPRQFECTRLITVEHVLATLDRMLPALTEDA